MLRLIQTYNPVGNSGMTFRVPQGNYRGFLLTLTGTGVGAANYLTPNADVGMIQIFDRGVPRVNISWREMHIMDQRFFGAPTSIWTAGATAAMYAVYVPASPDFQNMPNTWFCERDGDLIIQFNNGTDLVVGNITATQMSIYADVWDYPHVFNPMIMQLTDTIGAAVAAFQLAPCPVPNVTDIFIYPYSATAAVTGLALDAANLTRVMLDMGNGNISEQSYFAGWTLANMFDKIEIGETVDVADATAAVPKYLHLIPGDMRAWDKVLQSQCRLQVSTAAAMLLETAYFGGDFAGDRAFASREMARARAQQRFNNADENTKVNFTLSIAAKNGAIHTDAVNLAGKFSKTGIAAK
jgi:hypothetical protein